MISSQVFKESSLGLQIEGCGNLHSGSGTEEQRPTWQWQEGGESSGAGRGGGSRRGGDRSRGLWEVPPSSASSAAGQETSSPLTSVFSRLQPMAGVSICVYP